MDWLSAAQPRPDSRLGEGKHVAAALDNLRFVRLHEGLVAVRGGDLGRGQKAKARVSGLPLSRARAGARTHSGGVGNHGEPGAEVEEQQAQEWASGSHPWCCACSCFVLCPICNYRNYRGLLQTATIPPAFLSF